MTFDFVDYIHHWTTNKLKARLLHKWGMVCTCPWCRQTIQAYNNHSMKISETCAMFDTYTCGNCGGESDWEFGPVLMFRALGNPPKPPEQVLKADEETKKLLKEIRG